MWAEDELAARAGPHHRRVAVLVGAAPGLRGPVAGPGARTAAGCCKALTFQPSGAVVAAATTSLPEGRGRRAQLGLPLLLGARRQLHDGGAVGRGLPGRGRRLLRLHGHRGRLGGRAPSRRCRSCSASAASTTSPSARSPTCRGWRDSRPVRVGNGAWDQQQVDVYGELLGAAQPADRPAAPTSTRTPARSSARLADAAAVRWREPDQGIWEVRGEPRHFLYSKVMCWVALDRAIALAELHRRRRPRGALAARSRRDRRDRRSRRAGATPPARSPSTSAPTPWTRPT